MRALNALAVALRTREDGLLELAGDGPGSGRAPRLAPPRLLGAFEPVLMGWRSRAMVLGTHEDDIVTGGIFRGFALVDGHAAGVWRVTRAGVSLTPFDAVPALVGRALQRDGEAVVRFLGR